MDEFDVEFDDTTQTTHQKATTRPTTLNKKEKKMAKNDKTQEFELTFEQDRDTKNTIRYKEDATEGKEVVGYIYLKKKSVEALGSPDSIDVTIRAGE